MNIQRDPRIDFTRSKTLKGYFNNYFKANKNEPIKALINLKISNCQLYNVPVDLFIKDFTLDKSDPTGMILFLLDMNNHNKLSMYGSRFENRETYYEKMQREYDEKIYTPGEYNYTKVR